MKEILKRFLQVIMIAGLIAMAGFAIWFLYITRPEAAEKSIDSEPPLVEIAPVKLGTYRIDVPSQGMVQAKKRTTLASELSGKVVSVSDKFLSGGQFTRDEVILQIEDSDYRAALAEAESRLADAKVALTTEEARAEQAKRDWERLGRGGEPTPLTLRVPQITSAKARITAAEAAVEKARRDLARTKIKAPFNATLTQKMTDVGNFLAPGTPVAELFQTSPLEIRLPLSLDEIRFMRDSPSGELTGAVTLFTKVGEREIRWNGKISRTEGEVDRRSRSMHLVADIEAGNDSRAGLKLQPGLFVQAEIEGKEFTGIARVPAKAFLDLNRVVLVTGDSRLEFRAVSVLRREGDHVYVSDGLKEGDVLCLTELATMIAGTRVNTKPAEMDPPPLRP